MLIPIFFFNTFYSYVNHVLQEIAKAAKMKPTKFTYGPKEAILYALGGNLFVPVRKKCFKLGLRK